MPETGPNPSANDRRGCAECGAPLAAVDAQPLCPACIFCRLSTGATTVSPDDSPARAAIWASSADDEADTDFLSEYELLGEVGRGGMGVIYKAHQPTLNRTVALKVIHAAGLAGESARRRFQSEVKVAGRLNHPNIVPVFDVGVMDGCPCFSMEYFPGGSMAEWMRQPKRPIDESVRVLVKVTHAVSFAHLRGVLHRDLKPGNILMDAAGEPHVADFGLAKELNSNSNLTHSGAVLGSPNYMSPEQASGRSDSLTVATDIYSLGAILYEMLAGRPPFVAATPLETMRMVVEQEAPRPSTITGRADRDLEIICLKCLEKDPARRYATAAELAADLERWLRHEPIHARPASQSERFRKWVKRHPALAAVSASLFVVLVAGLTGVIWQWQKAEQARKSETLQLRRAEAALARSAISLADASLREGNGPAVRAALETVPVGLRDATWTYLLGESDTSQLLKIPGIKSLDSLAAHPTRPSVFAAADRAGRIVFFHSRDGSQPLMFAPGFTTVASNAPLRIAFSKAGDRVAVGRLGPGGIVVHDATDGRKVAEWNAPPSIRIEFSPDGGRLLQTAADRSRVILWNTADGAEIWMRKDGYHWACFLEGSSNIANYCWTEGLRLVTAANGVPGLTLPGSYLEKFAPQPGGSLLVAGNPLGFIRGFDLTDGRQRFELQPHESAISHLAFLPGGERFLTAATLPDGRQALECWDAGSGRALQTLTGGAGEIRNICVHPLSGELIVQGRELRLWETVSVPPLRVIRGENAHPSAMFWGGNDRLFGPDAEVFSAALLMISNDAPHVLWQPESQDHGQPSVSADGRRVAIGRYNSGHSIAVLEWNDGRVKPVASINPGRFIAHVRLSPNGDRLAITQWDFSKVRIHDVATGVQTVTLAARDVRRFSDLAWLNGGKHLAGLVTTHARRSAPGSVEQIVLWDTATGQIVRAVTNATVTNVACAAPDGRRFVEAGADRNVRLRNGTTLEVLREFRVHNAPITALAWHPTRPVLATAGQDLIIRLWNLDDGTRLEELRGPLSPPSVLSFSPDGTRLATAARDGAARIWEPRSLAEAVVRK